MDAALASDLDHGRPCGQRGRGNGRSAAPLFRRVALDLDSYRPAGAARLSTVVMDLLTTAVAEHADRTESLPAESRE